MGKSIPVDLLPGMHVNSSVAGRGVIVDRFFE